MGKPVSSKSTGRRATMELLPPQPDISEPSLHFVDGAIRILLNANAYHLTAVQKTSYSFADR